MKKHHHLKYYLAASVSLITFLVYLASLKNEFVEWDDGRYVFENPHIRSVDLSFFKWAFFDFYAANWHPLTWISHALDYVVWGLDPWGHHLTNNILHTVNTFLVVLLVLKLVEAGHAWRGRAQDPPLQYSSPFTIHDLPAGRQGSRFTLIAAGVTGLLFGLHPIHVESVAWVAERKDLLCALFYLLSILAYTRHATYAKGKGQGAIDRYYLLSLCLFICALLSKPMAVSLPLVLLILDWYPFQRVNSLKTFRAALIEKIPFIMLGLLSSVLTIFAQKAGEAMELMEIVPLSTRLLVAARSLISYLWKMIWPLELVPYYPYPQDASFLSPVYLLPVLLVTGTTIFCFVIAARQKLLLSVWGYYVITLAPVIGIVQVGGQAMADRYTYLPSLGPFLLLGLAWAWLSTRGHKLKKQGKILRLVTAAAAVILFSALAALTVNQIGVWKNSIDLWSYVIEKQPTGVPIAYNNRGKVFLDKGLPDEAIADLNKAIFLDPSFYRAYYNRGISFDKLGRFEEAIADFDRAISLSPSFHEAYYNRGLTYYKTGLFDKAIESFHKSLEIEPDDIDALVSRGISYAIIGQNDRAYEDFNKAILLNQKHVLAYLNRGKLFLNAKERGLAMLDFQKACALGNQEGCNAFEALRPR